MRASATRRATRLGCCSRGSRLVIVAWACQHHATVIDPLERWRDYGDKPDYAGLPSYGGAPYTQDPALLAEFDRKSVV